MFCLVDNRKNKRKGNWKATFLPNPLRGGTRDVLAKSLGVKRTRVQTGWQSEIEEKLRNSFLRTSHLPCQPLFRFYRRIRTRGRSVCWIGEWFSNPSFYVWRSGLVENQVERTLANLGHLRWRGSTWEYKRNRGRVAPLDRRTMINGAILWAHPVPWM